MAFAVFGYLATDTPSLLPRPWSFQGLIAGISAVIFHGVGVVVHLLWQLFRRWTGLDLSIRPGPRRVLRIMFLVLVVLRGVFAAAREQADVVNASKPEELGAPTSALRSGGPGSLVPWTTIGADGSTFVASGPTAEQVTAATGEPAKANIRIFADLEKGRTLEQTRDLALAEMDRRGAFQRKAVVVVTSTSTGFVNEWGAESVEYLMRGTPRW